MEYLPKNPNLAELDRLSQDRYDRPFVELDVDQRAELEDEVRDALDEARADHRPHSLIATRRFWQPVAAAPGVVAWGYAFEGGQFSRSAAHDAIARYIAEVSR